MVPQLLRKGQYCLWDIDFAQCRRRHKILTYRPDQVAAGLLHRVVPKPLHCVQNRSVLEISMEEQAYEIEEYSGKDICSCVRPEQRTLVDVQRRYPRQKVALTGWGRSQVCCVEMGWKPLTSVRLTFPGFGGNARVICRAFFGSCRQIARDLFN